MTMLPCRAAELLAGWSLVSYNASYSWDFQAWKASASFMTRRRLPEGNPISAIQARFSSISSTLGFCRALITANGEVLVRKAAMGVQTVVVLTSTGAPPILARRFTSN